MNAQFIITWIANFNFGVHPLNLNGIYTTSSSKVNSFTGVTPLNFEGIYIT